MLMQTAGLVGIPMLGLLSAAEAPLAPSVGLGFGDEELALFEELPVVVSGSRRPGKVTDSPVPISVLDGDDLRLGGYTQLADAVMFQPGVDVVAVDRNHSMIGIRGLHESFSDRTLTLVDGITADNPVYGGSEFPPLPVATQDISHIEIVRGPGGAAWGANAFNGVINVITQNPDDSLGTQAQATLTSTHDGDAHLRWGDFHGPVSWRLAVGYQEQASSQEASGVGSDLDWRRTLKSSGTLTWHWTPTTEIDAAVGYTHQKEGELVLLSLPTGQDITRDSVRAQLGLRQIVTDQATLSLRTYTNWSQNEDPSLLKYVAYEQGGTAQIDVSQLGPHTLTLGGDARWTHLSNLASTTSADDRFVLKDNPTDEYRAGLFTIDRWQVIAPVVLESQLRGDIYSGTGMDWAGRIATLTTIDDLHQQVIRVAVARAFRTPLTSLRGTTLDTAFIAPGVPLVTYRSNDLDNEHTLSLELGWSAVPWDGGLVRVDTYVQKYQDLIGYDIQTTPSGIPNVNFVAIEPQTLGDAIAYGGEVEVAQQAHWGRCSVWYAWNHFETDTEDTSVRAFAPAEHKVGVRSRWRLPWSCIGVVNYRYAASHEAPGADREIQGWHRLDVVLNWQPTRGPLDYAIGVHDVFDQTPAGVSLFTNEALELPGRTAFVRISGTF